MTAPLDHTGPGSAVSDPDLPPPVAEPDGETGDATVDIVLHLIDSDGTIGGLVERDGGAPQAFHGWLELTAVLDRARPRTRPPTVGDDW